MSDFRSKVLFMLSEQRQSKDNL